MEGGERRRHSLTCTGTTPAVTFPPTCPAHFAARGEGRAGRRSRGAGGGRCGVPRLGAAPCCTLGCRKVREQRAPGAGEQSWADGEDPLAPTPGPFLVLRAPRARRGDARLAPRSPRPPDLGSRAELDGTPSGCSPSGSVPSAAPSAGSQLAVRTGRVPLRAPRLAMGSPQTPGCSSLHSHRAGKFGLRPPR